MAQTRRRPSRPVDPMTDGRTHGAHSRELEKEHRAGQSHLQDGARLAEKSSFSTLRRPNGWLFTARYVSGCRREI